MGGEEGSGDELLALGGSPQVRARALAAAGWLAWWAGDDEASRDHHEEALSLFRRLGDRRGEMDALQSLATAMFWSAPEAEAAEDMLRQSLAIAEEIQDPNGIAKANLGLGRVRGLAKGDPAGAMEVLDTAVRLFEEAGNRLGVGDALVALAHSSRRLGELQPARGHYLRVLDLMAPAGNRPMIATLLLFLSALEGELGRHERAARLWGAAQAMREVTGAVAPPAAQRMIGDPVAAARQAIGDEAVERAMAEGRAMDFDTAVAYAREL